MSEPTPGTWTIDPKWPFDVAAGEVEICTANHPDIIGQAFVPAGPVPSRDEAKANARLIAAAKEMLAAHCENVRALLLLRSDLQGRVDASKLAVLEACAKRCELAIAKAGGEP